MRIPVTGMATAERSRRRTAWISSSWSSGTATGTPNTWVMAAVRAPSTAPPMSITPNVASTGSWTIPSAPST